MNVIPGINCPDERCARARFSQVRRLFEDTRCGNGERWVHLDIADGAFAPAVVWGEPDIAHEELTRLEGVALETHFMVVDPMREAERWLAVGARRIIVHMEMVRNCRILRRMCSDAGAELFAAVRFDEPLDAVRANRAFLDGASVLAVPPGFSGQEFRVSALEQIGALRKIFPGDMIEVDGGINPHTARMVKEAGADTVVSTSFLFGGDDPPGAFQELRHI